MKFKACFMTLLLIALQLFGVMGASAADDYAVVTANVTDNSIVVSGEMAQSRAGTDLILQLKDESSDVHAVEFTTSRFDSKGNVVFGFPKIYLPKNMLSGEYTIEISGTELFYPIVVPYNHVGADRMLEILSAVRDRGENTIALVVSNYQTDLDYDIKKFDNLEAEGLSVYETYMTAQKPYEVPETYTDPADIAIINEEIKRLLAEHEVGVALGEFEEILSISDTKAWITSYYDKLGFQADDPLTESLDESLIKSYVTEMQKKQIFADKLAEAQGLATTKEVRDYIYERALLSFIKEGRISTVKDMITKPGFDTLFTDIDSRLSTLLTKPAKLSDCLGLFVGNYYESYSLAVDALNAQIASMFDDDDSKNNSNSGGGGKGGSITIQSGAVKPGNVIQPPVQSQNNAFSDIADVTWAVEAINYLAAKNMVNGRTETTFAPNEAISRAEFIKMAMSALSLGTAEPKAVFGDVSTDAWYAPYVASAYEKGIVTGDENGNFNPDDTITRQDMVTILYRALGKNGDEKSCYSFIDVDKISAYALPAVTYFSTNGIVNGMGDGNFGPHLQATRAQAAVILYNIIKNS